MKKIILMLAAAVLLAACDTPERIHPETVHLAEATWCKANGGILWIRAASTFESNGDVKTCIHSVGCKDGAVYSTSLLSCLAPEGKGA